MGTTDEHTLHWDGLSTESVGAGGGGDAPPGDGGAGPPGGPAPPASGSFPPTTFAHFRIVASLGRGAMGHVYLAQDIPLRRFVAIKFVRGPGERQRARFFIEASALAMLDHPNIVTIFELGELDGQPYIVTEYVAGESLSACPKPMTWQAALALGVGMADGLAAAHRRNVLHRDIKPSNVIIARSDDIARSGAPKLLDFGLAKLQDTAEEPVELPPPGNAGEAPQQSGTETGTILGTPYYMAPEAWRGEASYAADVYSLGVVLYELCTGHVPFHHVPRDELRVAVQERDAPRLSQVAPHVAPDFAAVIERCLARDPDRRFPNGELLRDALSAIDAPGARTSGQWPPHARDSAQEHPYPGLRPFDAEDSRLFFGRDEDTRRVVARLRTDGMVLVAGTSGVGKSSLVRAGVLPVLAAYGLDERSNHGPHSGWEIRAWVPGMHPLQAMSAALRADVDMDEDALARALAHDPADVGRRLEQRARTGMVLFVDQLEELVTVARPEEAAQTSRALATLAARFPRLRVLATVRGDKLVEIGALPGLDAMFEPSVYILKPLSELQVRDAVVKPAKRCWVSFESEAMVRTLVRDTMSQAGGLPLLQSALALLWERRDRSGRIIPDSALADIGGVAGALSQQADRVLDALLPETRAAARTILLRLVTLHGSRVRHSKEDLLAGGAAHEAALAALVAGRLLVAREIDARPVYELAHEALIEAWPTLRAWLAEEDRLLQVKQQLARAAEEWERPGKPREMLWQGNRLRELEGIDVETLVPREQAFVRESHRMQQRAKRRRQLAVALIACALAAIYGGLHMRERLAIQEYLDQAREILDEAAALESAYQGLRAEAIALFAGFGATRPDAAPEDLARAESLWRRAVNEAPTLDRKLLEATRPLELALLLDPSHDEVRRELGRALYRRTLLAEDQEHTGDLSLLRERVAFYDAELAAAWQRPTNVVIKTSPPGLQMRLEQYEPTAKGTLVLKPQPTLRVSPAGASVGLLPGSYLVVVPAQGPRAEVRYPFRLVPDRDLDGVPATRHLELIVPLADEIPADMVYVPAGRYWFGFGGDEVREPIREWQLSPPPHERSLDAFFIARHETTYTQWIEFLRALPPAERRAHMPQGEFNEMLVELLETDSTFVFRYRFDMDQELHARMGEPIVYAQRDRNRTQDWLQFPVTGIDAEDVTAYAQWLASEGRVPDARLCREDEWERAARGADLRIYPHGDRLAPDDANIDVTYGRRIETFGFDQVGMHPASRSPFGLEDMIGNAREMTTSILEPGELALRSGAFFHESRTNPIVNREVMQARQRIPFVGFRICAQPPPSLRRAP